MSPRGLIISVPNIGLLAFLSFLCLNISLIKQHSYYMPQLKENHFDSFLSVCVCSMDLLSLPQTHTPKVRSKCLWESWLIILAASKKDCGGETREEIQY